MSSPNSFVIQTQLLSKSYGAIQALKDLNLQVPPHSIFGFLGPNGAGKTTTIKLLLGLAKPTSGSGTVFGLDVTRDSLAIRKRVGYLAQDPRYYEHYTARETLRFTAGFFYSGPKDAVEARIAETLELVGLSDKADRPIKGFSGGERQRLGIAQAQINYPDLLILDEPAASLDPMGRRDVLEVMERLRKHTTVFYSTHILSDVQRVSDTVAILNHGQLVAQAPIETLLSGSGKTVFSLAFQGDEAAARQRLQGEPWLGSIQTAMKNGAVHWNVSVTDEQAASTRLPRLILDDPQVTMVSFGRKTYDLEEVFMNIVEGEDKK